jgi:Cu/Ag efflux protein CusF
MRTTAVAIVIGLLGAPLVARAGDQPAGSVGTVMTGTAVVESVDQQKRLVTLKDPDGTLTTFEVGPAVKNLPQLKKGDHVVAEYRESVAYEVHKPGTITAGTGEAVARTAAKPGSKPAGSAAHMITVTATVEAIDPEASTVRLKGPEGNQVTVAVKDPKKLEGVSVGDLVEITYTRALAISVEPASSE